MKKLTAILFLLSGIGLATFTVAPLSIVHELCHGFVGMFFGRIEQIGWDYCVFTYTNYSALGLFLFDIAGYIGEAWIWATLFYLLSIKRNYPIGWFFFGMTHGTLLAVLFTNDTGPGTDMSNNGRIIVIMLGVLAACWFVWKKINSKYNRKSILKIRV